MKLIQTQTLSSAASFIELDSIPQNFTDLVVLLSARGTTAEVAPQIFMSFNSLGNSNRSGRSLQGDGSSVTTSISTNDRAGNISGSTAAANTYGNTYVYITNYSGNLAKTFSMDSVSENNVSASNQTIAALLWNSTAAITAIAFGIAGANNFVAGSTVSLYGILKGSDGITTTS